MEGCDLNINDPYADANGELSDWQLSSLYVWNSHLPDDVFARVSSELNQYLSVGSLP
jgi:hypothetical protein